VIVVDNGVCSEKFFVAGALHCRECGTREGKINAGAGSAPGVSRNPR
jgi:hypothetical protein